MNLDQRDSPVEAAFTPYQLKEFVHICNVIDTCTIHQAALLLNEILMCHSICCYNPNTRSLDNVEAVFKVNGDSIQLNLEKDET